MSSRWFLGGNSNQLGFKSPDDGRDDVGEFQFQPLAVELNTVATDSSSLHRSAVSLAPATSNGAEATAQSTV